MNRFLSIKYFVTFAALFYFIGCSKSTEPDPNAGQNTKNEIIMNAGYLGAVADAITETPLSNETFDGIPYEVKNVKEDKGVEDIRLMGYADDVLWPGALFNGNGLNNCQFNPIILPRNPLTLSINLDQSQDVTSPLSETVSEPKLSSMRDGMSKLINRVFQSKPNVPARVDFEELQVYSETQLRIAVKTSYEDFANKVKANFDFTKTTQRTKIISRYTQIYYTINIDHPANPTDFFPSSLSVDELRTKLPQGSKPVYLSGIDYGLVAYTCIETNESFQNMESALKYAYTGNFTAEVYGKVTVSQMLENSSIKIIVYGGSTKGIAGNLTGIDGFKKIVDANTNFNESTTPVPLVYKFRNLANNQFADLKISSEYKKYTPLGQKLTLTLKNLKLITSNETGGMEFSEIKSYLRVKQFDKYIRLNAQTDSTDYFKFWDLPARWDADQGDTKNTSAPNSVQVPISIKNNDLEEVVLEFYFYFLELDDWPNENDTYKIYIKVPLRLELFGTDNKLQLNQDGMSMQATYTLE